MLVISGLFKIQPDKIENFKSAAIKMQTASQAEDGCITFRVYQDLQDASLFRLFEEWETQEAHDAHHNTPHYHEISRQLPDLLAEQPTVRTYHVSSVT